MSAPRSSRSWRSKSVLVPIALSVAAAATAAGIWLWLDDHDHHHHHHSHDIPSDSEQESDAGGPSIPGSYLHEARAKRRPHAPHRSSSNTSPSGPSIKPPPQTSSTSTSTSFDNASIAARPALSRVDEESDLDSRHRTTPSSTVPQTITSPVGGNRTYTHPQKTRTVALVVSAQAGTNTLLTSLPTPLIIPANTTLHILIYTPSLTASQTAPAGSPHATGTQSQPPPPPSKIHELAYNILPVTYPKEYILPYTTHPTGTSSLLRHLSPEVVYMEETLAGEDGGVLRDLISKGWIREGIVVLGTGPGAIGGSANLAGLVDSSDEEGLEKIGYGEAGVIKGKEKESGVGGKGRRWWDEPGWDGGRGGGSVLERSYLAEDWGRRVVDRK